MPKFVEAMTQGEIAALPRGNHRVGGVSGLTLQISGTDARSWTLRYTAPDGRRREVGLGGVRDVPLRSAKAKALEMREALVLHGIDPLEARASARAARREAKALEQAQADALAKAHAQAQALERTLAKCVKVTVITPPMQIVNVRPVFVKGAQQ